MIAAAALTPLNPSGAKPPAAPLVWFSGLVSPTPTARQHRMIPHLTITITLREVADSWIPLTRSTVRRATTANAGKSKITGSVPIRGGADHADARYWVPGSLAPAARAVNASCAVR